LSLLILPVYGQLGNAAYLRQVQATISTV